MVIEACVVKSCLGRERGSVGRCPGARYVLAEGLSTRVERGEAPGSALTPNLGVEVPSIAPRTECSRAISPVLPPPDPPDDFAAGAAYLLDTHRALRATADVLLASAHSTERSEGPAALGAVTRPRPGATGRDRGVLVH